MRFSSAAIASLAGMVFGCIVGDPGTVVHPEPSSTANHLLLHAFVLPDSLKANRHLVQILVQTCRVDADTTRRTMWQVERGKKGSRPEGPFIEYGAAPSGWTVRQPPQPLAPGCYMVSVAGGGIGSSRRFLVSNDGAIELVRF